MYTSIAFFFFFRFFEKGSGCDEDEVFLEWQISLQIRVSETVITGWKRGECPLQLKDENLLPGHVPPEWGLVDPGHSGGTLSLIWPSLSPLTLDKQKMHRWIQSFSPAPDASPAHWEWRNTNWEKVESRTRQPSPMFLQEEFFILNAKWC